jgi:membrane protease YdiL (CAAX protease family)
MGNAAPLLALALATLLVLPGLWQRSTRPWLIAFIATLVMCLGLQALPGLWPGERAIGERWNWSGQVLMLAGALWIAAMLSRRAGLSWPAMGFTWRQQPGSMRAALAVAATALSLHLLAMSASRFRLVGVSLETWLYQATLPGLVEEVLFRGVLLALLDRVFVARRVVLGASIGWGGVVVTLVFVALHGLDVAALLGVLPAALLYLWLRARTGSLVLPVIVHNLWNLSVYAAHL